MAHVDHTEAYKDLRDRVLDGIRETFPIKGTLQTVELHGLEVKEGDLHADDIRDQHKSKVNGKTWASTVYGEVSLRDNKTGKVISRRKMRMAEVPRVTRRRSYIIDGTEYQVDNQWQLKPGIYAKRRVSGELEAAFNVPNRRSFDITFNPESKQFLMQRGGSKAIPVYPLLKTLGIDDDSLERSWGKDILAANKGAKGVSTGLEKFFRVDKKRAPKDKSEAETYLIETMNDSKLRPDATKATLGKAYENVTGDSIRQATAKLLRIQAGDPEDDRDSLIYKDLRTTGDFAYDKLTSRENQRSIRGKVIRKMFKATDVRDVIKFDMFNEPVRQTFYSNAAARSASQVNPVEMLAGAQQTTVMGPGGVQSQNAVDKMVGLKFVNPSHMGYLDPVRTPESEKSGVVLRLPMGLMKKGKEPVIPMYNLKTGKVETVGPNKFNQSVVVLPDQVEWKDGKPKPKGTRVKASIKGNEPGEVSMKEADYVLRHPSQLFSITTNLIPFLGNNSGNRATYAGQHLEQAISLQNREAPLVQVGTGTKQKGLETFEDIIGKQAAHQSPIDGTVTEVREDAVVIKGADGVREVQLYNNFPLNDPKAVLHSTAAVKPGQKVKAGDSVADTNFTRQGKLALGTNLRVAYIPYKGYNFEDGVVISESAANKMTSEHMHKPELALDKGVISSPNKFLIQHPDAFSKSQYGKLDKDGVVRVGQKVQPGDPLVLGMRPFQARDRMSLQAIGRALSGRHTDVSLKWQSDHPGEVVAVHRDKGKVVVHVRTQEPMQVGDKLAGRHGNKGIVTKIVPDKEMPHTPDGKHIEVALNPSGVPGRMNVGQVLETAASKISEKTGKPYIVENFGGEDQLAKVKKDLKAAGLTDQEELFDPTTGLKLGKALVGPQHMLKLMHQIDKKHSARSGMALPGGEEDPEAYDANLLPAQGGKSGGQSVGHLDLYTLLAHGAKANIREMQTYKSEGPDPQPDPAKRWPSQHGDVWNAIQLGEPLPPPRSTFSFRKFTDMLKASGINVEKKGHHFQLLPLTDKQVLDMSSGEVTKPGEVVYPNLDPKSGEPKPKAGGIFDERATGGHGGKKWSHIALAEPLPNPIFEKAIQRVTGLTEKEYFSVVQGKKGLKGNKLVEIDVAGAQTGGPAIVGLLDKIDVKKELQSAEKELSNTSIPTGYAHRAATPKIDKLVKKVKYLRALEQADIKPSDAYVLKNLPVLPPAMRPISTLKDGSVKWGDLNELYKNLGTINTAMKDPSQQKLGDDQKQDLRESLYDGVRALTGVGTYKDQTHKGIIHQIVGDPTKEGYFQKTLMSRRQDMSMRSTIVPEPAMGLDEVGLPKSKALTLYKPFVVRKLVEMGAAPHVLEARKLVQNNDPMVYKALERVAEERPVLLKRDPALHRHSIQAFKPRLVTGKAIQIHPLVTSGYNADFDGDTMSAYVPVSNEAVEEARNMMPSANLYSEASGRVVYSPTLESALGIYKLGRVGKDTGKTYQNAADALKAVNDGKLDVSDIIKLRGMRTTPGKILLASALPEPMQKKMLTAHKPIDKRGLENLLKDLAEQHKGEYGDTTNKLKDLGNGASSGAVPILSGLKGPDAIKLKEQPKNMRYVSVPVHSLSLDDFEPDRESRDKAVREAERAVANINRMSIPKREKDRRSIEVWVNASKKMDEEHMRKVDKSPSNLALMLKAGVKPSATQYKQMVLSPVLMSDAAGNPINQPIKKSYSEGLDLASYWTQQQGARRGTVMKVQEVRDPGTFTKRMIQTTMDLVVTGDDCGTNRGIAMSVGDSNVYDRRLAADVKVKDASFEAGTLLTPQIVDRIRAADKGATVVVRSPLKCEHAKGLCKKCAGLRPSGQDYESGTNIGVIASQALGERSVQLTMKAFHSGGVVQSAGGASRAVNDFERVQQLTDLTENIPNAATVAMKSGTVEKIEKDRTGVNVWINGVRHHVGKDRSGAALHENLPHATRLDGYKGWRPPKVGMRVRAGEVLSDPNRTNINPRDLYRATNDMETVQNFLVDELSGIYGNDVRRQHVETVVRAMGNLTKVRDPGDAEGILRGEFQSAADIRALNKKLVKAGKRPVEHSPVLKGVDNMPLAVQEDWLAKMQHIKLKNTLLDAASVAARSNIHGPHPVPGIAYGAEFGMTSKDALKPGLKHLADVPQYAY